MTLHLSPKIEATLTAAAEQRGVDIETLIERMVQQQLPPIEEVTAPKLSPKNAATLVYLRNRIANEATNDPEEIRKADAEAEELLQNLNKNRIESGESSLFP